MHRIIIALSWCLPGIGFWFLASLASAQNETKSALKTNPKGWIDLLADKDLKDWKRVPIPPGSKLREKSPWSVDEKEKVLICDGVGIHEMLLYNRELGDGIFHVEWRFKKPNGTTARSSRDTSDSRRKAISSSSRT